MRRIRLDGSPDVVVNLPGMGSVHAVSGEPGNREAFILYGSFNQAETVYKFDV